MNDVGPLAPKRFCPISGCLVMNEETKTLELVPHEQVARQMGVQLHSITFSEVFEIKTLDWKKVAHLLKKYDEELQEKTASISLFKHFIDILYFRTVSIYSTANFFLPLYPTIRQESKSFGTKTVKIGLKS